MLVGILMQVQKPADDSTWHFHFPALNKHLALITSNVSRNNHGDKNNCIPRVEFLKLLNLNSCFWPMEIQFI